jgi:hypothetical protein
MSKTLLRHTLINKYFWHFCWLPYLYSFSLYKNASFIIVSAETEYISTRSFNSPGPVACFSDEDDVSGNQNNCYWSLHNESVARCKHHMQEKLRHWTQQCVFCLYYIKCVLLFCNVQRLSNNIGGVVVSMLIPGALDRGFQLISGQIKVCWFLLLIRIKE